jgi:hypothetical protein
MIKGDFSTGVTLAIWMFFWGEISLSEINFYLEKIKKGINFIWWNTEGFKFGICDQKFDDKKLSILSL